MHENKYKLDELIIFVVRNGFVRIIMSGLLIICYLRAICENKKLWILSKVCYAGLVYLIIDWWIILLKTHVHRKIGEYFWINSGVAIFIICKLRKYVPIEKISIQLSSYNATVVVSSLCIFYSIC